MKINKQLIAEKFKASIKWHDEGPRYKLTKWDAFFLVILTVVLIVLFIVFVYIKAYLGFKS